MKNKLELKNINFSFNSTQVIKNFSLTAEEKSFTTLLGPSGCGKTTLLRLISGFLEPDDGEILIDGINQKGIEVNKRKIGIVFQDYALFPHLTVEQNLLYGLKSQSRNNKKSGKAPHTTQYIQEMLHYTAQNLGIEALLNRYPHELSGGQQQRVALGRSLALSPEILLMDEPLSSLDTQLRTKVREELKEIQAKLGFTTVYVTHDQEEALSLSTKIAVLNNGELLQEGTPFEVYFQPKDRFTAGFVGKANFIEENSRLKMIRPEWFSLVQDSSNSYPSSNVFSLPVLNSETIIEGTVKSLQFLGSKTRITASCSTTAGNETEITADLDTLDSQELKTGKKILLRAKKSHILQ